MTTDPQAQASNEASGRTIAQTGGWPVPRGHWASYLRAGGAS